MPSSEWDSLSPGRPLLCLPAVTSQILRFESAILRQYPAEFLGEKSLLRLRLLVDEIFSNICRHAYAGPAANLDANPAADLADPAGPAAGWPEAAGPGQMALYVEPGDGHGQLLRFWAIDWGAPFDLPASLPAAAPEPASLGSAPEKLGLYLIGQASQSLEYKRAVFPKPGHLAANLLRVSLALADSHRP